MRKLEVAFKWLVALSAAVATAWIVLNVVVSCYFRFPAQADVDAYFHDYRTLTQAEIRTRTGILFARFGSADSMVDDDILRREKGRFVELISSTQDINILIGMERVFPFSYNESYACGIYASLLHDPVMLVYYEATQNKRQVWRCASLIGEEQLVSVFGPRP